ncbi:hypothetical protein IFM89_014512 [Coptis chinensis]|uniref:Serine-threonine/tyrosine-protein kinase catalytic domain-containing protein n=1 Tax=Coptis chinensis TaxID=261450 RepID=A0A835LIK7_9MAGN|nr:hypothetical protein IFM89_014512 [Coptis chinensis]
MGPRSGREGSVEEHQLGELREFENELNLLSAMWHENLVPLIGYCYESDQQILVYPFMSNGSLQDRLYGGFGTAEHTSEEENVCETMRVENAINPQREEMATGMEIVPFIQRVRVEPRNSAADVEGEQEDEPNPTTVSWQSDVYFFGLRRNRRAPKSGVCSKYTPS